MGHGAPEAANLEPSSQLWRAFPFAHMLRLSLFASLLLASAAPATAQETTPADQAGDQDDRLQFGGLVQTQFNTTSADAEDDTALTLRRVRLGVVAEITPAITGRIEAELANAAVGGAAELNEAYVLYQPVPAFGVLAGKGGRPFGIVDLTGAAALVPIERGARFRGADPVAQYKVLEALAYAGRSVGVQVLGDVEGLPIGLTYAAGYFTGSTGEEGDDADIRQLAARLTLTPIEGVAISGAATSRVFAQDDPIGLGDGGGATGADPQGETQRGSGYALDIELGNNGSPGFHLVAEAAIGTINPYTDDRFQSIQGWIAYRLPVASGGPVSALEPLFRASYADVDGPLGARDGILLTPGVNVYGAEGTRLMFNLDLFLPSADGEKTLTAFRAQAQVSF